MFALLLWALVASGLAGYFAYRLERWRPVAPKGDWVAPVPDPGRYQVVFHISGETHELYHGFDPTAARHAYENAPMEAGMLVEFYDAGRLRGGKSA